jgi:seryl-tRNA synthetase
MAGKPTKDTVLLNVDVNTDPARKGLNDLNNTTRDLEKTNKDLRVEMQKLEAQGKKDTQEYRNLQTQIKANDATIKANKARMSEMRKEIGLNNLTMRELRSEAKKLRNQLENTVPNTPEWNDLNNQLGDVNNRMGELRKMGGKTDGVFGKLKGAVGGLLPAFGFAAIIAGVGKIIGKLYEMFEIITKNRTALHQMTGATGSEPSQLTAAVTATATSFNKTF